MSEAAVEPAETISQLLAKRSVRGFHAIGLSDFRAYAKRQAILSRSELSEENPRYCRFFSDAKDVRLGVWDHTFLNLVDIGNYFWTAPAKSVPNAYGPITLVANHGIWANRDVVVRDYSISNPHASLVSSADLEATLVQVPQKDFWKPKSTEGRTYEVDVEAREIQLPRGNIAFVVVDPISWNGGDLPSLVREAVGDWLTGAQVVTRGSEETGVAKERMELLLNWAASLEGRLLHRYEDLGNTVPDSLRDWFDGVTSRHGALASWLTYVHNGTLLHM